MKKNLMHGLMVLVLLLTQVASLAGVPVNAIGTPEEQVILDEAGEKVTVRGEETGDEITWTVNYSRASSPAPRAFKLRVSTDQEAANQLAPEAEEHFQATQATVPADRWFIEEAYSRTAKGTLKYTTKKAVRKIFVAVQVNQKGTSAATASSAEVPVHTTGDEGDADADPDAVQPDVLTAEQAGPHEITLPEAEAPAPPTEDVAEVQEATAGDAKEIGGITEPGGGDDLQAVNLMLSATTKAQPFKIAAIYQGNEVGADHQDIKIYEKGVDGSVERDKYGDQSAMENKVSTEYTNGTSSAVIFPRNLVNSDSLAIQVYYGSVGHVLDAAPNPVEVGAYVTVTNIKRRENTLEWGPNHDIGIDFSSNFYSGMSITNIFSFDWQVQFFQADDPSHLVNFSTVPNSDGSPQLTFTSLNPGEFAGSKDGLTANMVKPEWVKNTAFWADQLGPENDKDKVNEFRTSNSWVEAGSDEAEGADALGYTARYWGNWDTPRDLEEDEWGDALDGDRFEEGAVAFNLAGNTFTFVRGTGSQAGSTWLANASGDIKLYNPDVAVNKSVTTDPNAGGGTKEDIAAAGEIYTDNQMAEKNVNDYYVDPQTGENSAGGQQLYYYLNQELYSQAGDFIVRPDTIVITDELPAGVKLSQKNDVPAVSLFGDRNVSRESRPIALAKEQITESIKDGRTTVTVTLNSDQISKMLFTNGFFSIRLAIEPTTAEAELPENLPEGKFWMENTATSKWYMKGREEPVYDQETNMVRIYQDKRKTDVSFTKVGEISQVLAGAQFALYTGETQLYKSNVTDKDGRVTFTNVRPGSYQMKEIATPTGHSGLPAEGILVTITADGKITWDSKYGETGKLKNSLKPFQLDLTKRGEPNDLLDGAIFKITGSNDVNQMATTEGGKLTFTGLKAGEYTLEEVQAPTGYQALEGQFKLTIMAEGDVKLTYTGKDVSLGDGYTFDAELTQASLSYNQITMSVDNEPLDPVLPATGGPGTGLFVMIAGLLVMLAFGLWFFFRHTREMEVR
ncbi:MSCRAMM family protein [Lacticaseibacillus hegangensis]|uniref:Collagen binding domain-containing protein n=1 Tax=Lacticaseibacillus hegangensis TaxID=2486010 RepID=A0ABW4CUR0_9LACO|nr:SpaA isopeptide-forming pilin-related protein [Lacticaseibacillus hegangensis]